MGRVWEVAWAGRVWEVGVFSFNLSKGVAVENFGLAPRFPNSAGDFEAGAQIMGLGWNLLELAQ